MNEIPGGGTPPLGVALCHMASAGHLVCGLAMAASLHVGAGCGGAALGWLLYPLFGGLGLQQLHGAPRTLAVEMVTWLRGSV